MIYVLSDIHGNLRRFNAILTQIQLQPEDTLYILGDVIDRHRDGIPILRKIMSMPNAKMLLGNHEYMMLRALNQPYDAAEVCDIESCTALWYRNGGKVTHDHWKHIRKQLRSEIIAYLRSLPLTIRITVSGRPFQLVHGAPPQWYDGNARYRNPTYYAVWKRLEPSDSQTTDYTIIFGHTTTHHYQSGCPMHIYYGENCIGIDCGSGYPGEASMGRLACLRLDDMKEFYG